MYHVYPGNCCSVNTHKTDARTVNEREGLQI
jgi:hypothetical protein